jgi:hypothetical protein
MFGFGSILNVIMKKKRGKKCKAIPVMGREGP